MVETLTYDALSSNKLSAMADIEVRVLGNPFCQGHRSADRRFQLSNATTVAQNLFLHLVHFPRAGARLIIEAMQM
jgi:hypothetical protein